MFENAVEKCPSELWTYNYSSGKEASDENNIDDIRGCFWYVAYHTLFFTDYYLDMNPEKFKMPEPFTQNESDFDEVMPPKNIHKGRVIVLHKLLQGKITKLTD